jgi:hypothetical protein
MVFLQKEDGFRAGNCEFIGQGRGSQGRRGATFLTSSLVPSANTTSSDVAGRTKNKQTEYWRYLLDRIDGCDDLAN